MVHLTNSGRCRAIIGMGPHAFAKLCDILRDSGRLKDARRATVEEQDCIGAIDGTHIHAKVPLSDAPRFRGRKEYPTQNVLAACSFDMTFTYVLPEWEGTASDSRIIKNALNREDRIIIPRGKYYLVDEGFMLTAVLLASYRGVRYHLKEYSMRGPENARELFNNRHVSLRNIIERAFGVLKKRFAIISGSTEPHYSFETQTEILLACCILHNYLMGMDPDMDLIAEVEQELMLSQISSSSPHSTDEYGHGVLLRDQIATTMWHDYPPHQ